MSRNKKITSDSSIEEIKAEISKVEEEIAIKATELKELKSKKRTLNKWLSDAECRETEEKNKATLDRVVAIMKEKGISVDDVEAMLNK